ncbi:unnamed protein product [Adineta steineri]|uniref:TROVE domain-containing protein n=1 Tax=Adineta steineri TaxID=433720 RepID=A0A814C1G1_9BILA|nr:unnamed protein product [Adineta steineri]CAF0935507.1 unnamed protein product [Adineta steineri]
MADAKKPSTASSLLSTTNSLLSTKNTALTGSSLFQGSSLLTVNTTSSLLSGTGTNKQTSLFSSSTLTSAPPKSSLTSFSLSTAPKPSLSSFSLTSPLHSSSFLSTTKLPTSNTLFSSFNTNNASSLTTDTSLSRKRKAEPLESTQETLKNSVLTSTTIDTSSNIILSNENECKYNIENIKPLDSKSIHLGVNLHCHVPAPKRPRMDPFSSIFTRLENTTDDDFNVGIKSIKKSLLNSLADSLLSQPDLRKATDQKRSELIRLANLVVDQDPEFILKAALYTRNHLNIRITANFLVAYAAYTDSCRIFLKKYFKTIVNLPSDWIEIAELYQTFFDKRIHFGSLPSALRRVMIKKFPDFDKYQLAKYNKEKARLKKAKKANAAQGTTSGGTRGRGGASSGRGGRGRGSFRGGRGGRGASRASSTDSNMSTTTDEPTLDKAARKNMTKINEEDRETRRMAFTLKRLIRQLHISEPVEHVWCLLGKRYPETSEQFYLSRLPGVFEGERANKRMKLPTPETWETQISLKGNKAAVWQQLIDNKKLPFMAMLRNLRNMIKAGIDEKHHQWVLKKLSDEGAVTYSRQFPFRFFSAYQVLDELEEEFNNWCSAKETVGTLPDEKKRLTKEQKDKKSRLTPSEKAKKLASKEMPYDLALLQRYRKALDCSVKIATQHNCQPIPGRTFVFCNLSDAMSQPCQAARGLGKPRTRAEIGLLMGLMCKSACESSRLIVYKTKDSFNEIEQTPQQTILNQMTKILTNTEFQASSSDVCIPPAFLTNMIAEKQWFDNIIIVSDGLKSDTAESDFVYRFLSLYRYLVNSELMFVSIDLSISQCSLTKSDRFNNRNDIFLSGFSDSILQFIAERGNDGQLLHVENIDNAHNLNKIADIKNDTQTEQSNSQQTKLSSRTPITTLVPRWRTVRVFISSTFKDMHAERDLLTRYVFPELRQRAKSLFVNLYQTDLRWGIAESQTKQSVYLCLNEVCRSDYFIGLIGERYGYVPTSYDVPKDDPRFTWLKKVPLGRSITDLEVQAGAFHSSTIKQNRAFFYFRDPKFLQNVHKPWSDDFLSENDDSKIKVSQLKQHIRSSGFETFDGYPCTWQGVANDRPLVTDLDEFAQRVIDNLWTSLQEEYKPEYVLLDDNEIEDNQHKQYRISFMEHFVSRTKVLQDTIKSIGTSSVILLTGQQGSGKTAAIAAIANKILSNVNTNVKLYEHYVGITRSSSNSISMLRRLLCQIINDHSELQNQFPIDQIRSSNYTDLCKILSDVFLMRKNSSNIVICIDGIELLDNDTLVQTLNFIPKDFNFDKITFILTATEDSIVEQACKKLSNLLTINLTNLELLERSEIVRKHLDRFGKKLDEQAFSSQMKFITSKRDSFKPSYLTLICEELLLMTDYEKKITEKLKLIPQKQNLFLLEIFKRLDVLFGEKYVATVFGLIYLARQDLTEQELRDLMNISFGTVKTLPPPENYTYPITTTPLQLADFTYNCHILLKPQLYDGPQTVSIASNEIRQIIKTRYLRSNDQQLHLYKLLAFYYWCEATGSNWTSMNVKAFEHLPFYLYTGDEFKLYSTILTDLKFIAGKCRVGLVQSLIDDYELINTTSSIAVTNTHTSLFNRAKKPLVTSTKDRQTSEIILQQYRSFIQRNSHILAVNPSLIYQQALNELETSPVFDNIQQILSNQQENSINNENQITAFVRINKPENMEQMKYSIEGFTEPIRCLAVSPSGLYLAAGSADCLIRLYNTSTSRLLKLFVGHAAPISALCFVGNDHLASGSNDGGLSVWDVANGHRLHILTPKHDKRVSELSSNQRGTQFASVSWDSYVRIWDLQKARKETEIHLHPKPVSSVAFHPDGFMLVTGCWDGIVRQWNVTSGQRKSVMRGHLSSIKTVAYSADGRYIASCSIDGECRLWNALVGSQVGVISARISSIYFSPSGSELASAGNDGRVRVFSSTIGQCQMIIQEQAWGAVSSIVIHPEGEYIIAGYHSGSLRIFDIQNGTSEQEFHYHKGRINRLQLSSSGTTLISASNDSFSRIFDIKDLGKRNDMRIQTTILKGHTAAVLSCAMNKLNMIATGSEDATICFYKPSKLFEQSSLDPNEILTQHRTPVTGLTFNNETRQLLSASRDGQVHIWNISQYASTSMVTLTNTLAHCHADWINDIALSNTNNGLLATASNDNTLKIWNTIPKKIQQDNEDNDTMDIMSSNTEEARVTLRGHQGSVNTVCFSYGCIVSGSLDKTIRVWSHKGTEITCLRGHTEKITSCDLWVKFKGVTTKTENDTDNKWSNAVDEQEVELSRSTHTIDKMLVVSASEDNSIRIWRPTDPEQRCVYDAHAQPLNDIVVSNESIVTSSLDKTLRSWQIPTNVFQHNNSTTSAMTPQIVEPDSHLDEITSIAVSRDNSLVFTVSRDAYLFIWSLISEQNDDYDMDTNINKTKMSKQPFRIIQSIKAHDETILGMGLIRSDHENHTLVTGSVDKNIKIWTISHKQMQNKCSIKRLRTDTTVNGPVSFISGQYDMPYFVVGENQSFDSLTFHLYSSTTLQRLKTYQTQTCHWPLSSILTLNEQKHCILTIGSTSNELCSYDLSLIDTTDSKLYVSYASTIEYITSFPSEWITSIENLDDNKVFYLGTSNGNIYSTTNLFTDINTWNKNQLSSKQRSITGLCSINNEFIFTSGFDNVIRVQYRTDHTNNMNDDNDDEQEEKSEILGQYPVPAPITQMRTWKQKNNGTFGVVAGDTLGNLYLVQWYSS